MCAKLCIPINIVSSKHYDTTNSNSVIYNSKVANFFLLDFKYSITLAIQK